MKAGKSYIEMMLTVWGSWVIARGSKSVGFANESPMFRTDVGGGSFGPRMPRGIGNREIFVLDSLVRLLPEEQQVAVVGFYTGSRSLRDAARKFDVRRDTFTERLYRAQRTLDGALYERMREARQAEREAEGS